MARGVVLTHRLSVLLGGPSSPHKEMLLRGHSRESTVSLILPLLRRCCIATKLFTSPVTYRADLLMSVQTESDGYELSFFFFFSSPAVLLASLRSCSSASALQHTDRKSASSPACSTESWTGRTLPDEEDLDQSVLPLTTN